MVVEVKCECGKKAAKNTEYDRQISQNVNTRSNWNWMKFILKQPSAKAKLIKMPRDIWLSFNFWHVTKVPYFVIHKVNLTMLRSEHGHCSVCVSNDKGAYFLFWWPSAQNSCQTHSARVWPQAFISVELQSDAQINRISIRAKNLLLWRKCCPIYIGLYKARKKKKFCIMLLWCEWKPSTWTVLCTIKCGMGIGYVIIQGLSPSKNMAQKGVCLKIIKKQVRRSSNIFIQCPHMNFTQVRVLEWCLQNARHK